MVPLEPRCYLFLPVSLPFPVQSAKEKSRVDVLASGVKVPAGAPRIRDWYAERTAVIGKTCDRLGIGRSASDFSEKPRVVGLAGPSGAGKSTVASMMIARADVRASFHKGVLWLQVGKEAKDRLPELMIRLAGMVYEIVMRKGCRPPRQGNLESDHEDGGAYIREVVDDSSRRFLVVADNVWEVEVLQELEEAGVWVLYTTRDDNLTRDSPIPKVPPLRVDEVLEEEAELVLKRAAELDENVHLPEAAYTLMARSNYVVLDLALVGRWGGVRGRGDEQAWRKAVTSIEKVQVQRRFGLSWRAAVLHAGLDELANDNVKHKELYLSLVVIPKGLAFPSEVAGVLLYGGDLSDKDLEAAREVVATLERWSILTLESGGMYRVYDEHADFVQEMILSLRRDKLGWWRSYISSVPALLTYSSYALMKMWERVAQVGGDEAVSLPFVLELDAMDPSSAELPEALGRAARFYWRRKDWTTAYRVNAHLLRIVNNTVGEFSQETASTLHSLAACASNAGWRGSAEAFCRQALEITKGELGDSHLDVARMLYSLGVCLYAPKQTMDAERFFLQALAIRHECLGADHLDVAQVLHSLGVCAYSGRRLEEAESFFRQALAIRKKKLGADHPDLASTTRCLAECAGVAGRTEEAMELLRAVLVNEKPREEGDLLLAKMRADRAVGSQISWTGQPVFSVNSSTGYTYGVYGQDPSTKYVHGTMYGRNASTGYYIPGGYRQSPVMYGQEPAVHGHNPNMYGHYHPSPINPAYNPSPVCCPAFQSPVAALVGSSVNDTCTPARNQEAEFFYRRALLYEEATLGPGHAIVASTLYKLGGCATAAGKTQEAEEFYRRALNIWEKNPGVHHIKLASTIYELGGCAYAAGRVEEARHFYARARSMQEETLGVDHPDVAHTLNKLGLCARKRGRTGEVEACFLRALSIFEKMLGVDHPHVAATLINLGGCVYDGGRVVESEEYFRRALAIRETTLGAEHTDVATTLHCLGLCAEKAGRREEAEKYYWRALSIQEQKPGFMSHPDAGNILYNLGFFADRAGKIEEADRYLRSALDVQKAKLPFDHPYVGLTLHTLGACACKAGRAVEAEGFYCRALLNREKTLGVDHPSAAETRSALAELRQSSNSLVWPQSTFWDTIWHRV